jgi:hypothetical protein
LLWEISGVVGVIMIYMEEVVAVTVSILWTAKSKRGVNLMKELHPFKPLPDVEVVAAASVMRGLSW